MSKKDFLYTYSGKVIDLHNPDAADINLSDIAFSLANQRRYGGHNDITILQHSVMVAEHFTPFSDCYLHALMHDAAEAYMIDIPTYLKKYITEEYKSDFKQIEKLIFNKYAVPYSADIVRRVKDIDLDICHFEMDAAKKFNVSKSRYLNTCNMTDPYVLGMTVPDKALKVLSLTRDELIDLFMCRVYESSSIIRQKYSLS